MTDRLRRYIVLSLTRFSLAGMRIQGVSIGSRVQCALSDEAFALGSPEPQVWKVPVVRPVRSREVWRGRSPHRHVGAPLSFEEIARPFAAWQGSGNDKQIGDCASVRKNRSACFRHVS